ncbi:TRAP transporter small permease [Celeribacter indicus]|uniref:TRAP transporter small permease protein n=1 Tax=Celeribacter indicus TaxID=1208324 RepID=A0A0B5DN74_9RHOB|nr:TRAP transporter small permease [Celeribacter indicus]AJE45058.1 TRAP dicarboxylate transporter subunit DctQ [Celeribacter indicus]SDX42307.1 TRAP-type C4-dicarboxylate transport system, small permease component [Celeribacter indicus]
MSSFSRLMRASVGTVNILAAILLATVTLLTFVMVVLRPLPGVHVPGVFDLSRLMLGVSIFWGLAVACYRGSHIRVDLVYQAMPRVVRKAMDLIADTAFAVFLLLMSWNMAGYILHEMRAGLKTYELNLPVWPFYALAWLGGVMGCAIMIGRVTARLAGRKLAEDEGNPDEQ